jgi:hypothetical protein
MRYTLLLSLLTATIFALEQQVADVADVAAVEPVERIEAIRMSHSNLHYIKLWSTNQYK